MTAEPQQPSSDASQVERAYREIKAGIVNGRYRAGAPLSEVMLAREHQMSRTPVREGLTRLWQEQYLDRVAGHGYFVARVTVQLIHDTFDVRRVLEGAAAAWAAERATDDEVAEMHHLASLPQTISTDARQSRIDAPAEYRDSEAANVRFHLAIAAAARNSSPWSSSIAAWRKSIGSCRSVCILVRFSRAPPKRTSPSFSPSSAAIRLRRVPAWRSTSTAAAG